MTKARERQATPIRRIRHAAAAVLILACIAAHAEAPVEVMVLGTYHMANPGQDLHNMEADDVTTDKRQAELEALSRALQAFGPNKVAVEHDSDRDDLGDPGFDSFEPTDLRKERNETVQIGYRLAHDLGLDIVYGIDEKSDEIEYFPYGQLERYARENGEMARLDALNAYAASHVEGQGRAQASNSIAGMLRWINQPDMIQRMQEHLYYRALEIADGEEQPGALLNGRYYLRNARIFSKLTTITEPGDRVVVVFGAGHAYWLRHFIRETPGYEIVEPNLYLEAAGP